MKKLLFTFFFMLFAFTFYAQVGYEFFQMTTVESVVPGGLGRSRLIMTDEKGAILEAKMENFFSMVGINFENIRANDKMIGDKISELASKGWELQHVYGGAYGHQESTGIFITRYIFRRPKN
ncbi:MAG: hypothetical protein ACOVOO_03110 [Flavobacteriales bacterium]|mgnify:CR=1 FL=1|jgi:hypothetical protein